MAQGERLPMRISAELKGRLEDYAQSAGLKTSAVVRAAIERYIGGRKVYVVAHLGDVYVKADENEALALALKLCKDDGLPRTVVTCEIT